MALPAEIIVKISSEIAGSIAMERVSSRPVSVHDLLEQMLGTTGKDIPRIQEILRRGSLVSGESRLRWEPLDAAPDDLAPLLARFPDPQPGRPFDGQSCFHIRLLQGRDLLDLPRVAAARRRLFRRRSFWDAVLDLAASIPPDYVGYSYKLRCDHYRVHLDLDRVARIAAAAQLLKSNKLATRIRGSAYDTLDLFVRRS